MCRDDIEKFDQKRDDMVKIEDVEVKFSLKDLRLMKKREEKRAKERKTNFIRNFKEEMNREPTEEEIDDFTERFQEGKISFFKFIDETKNRCNSGMQELRQP